MCFDRSQQVFRYLILIIILNKIIPIIILMIINIASRWGLSDHDKATTASRGIQVPPVVEVDQARLSDHLTEDISKDIFSMVTSLDKLNISNHVYILLILIQVFSRDGLQMAKQVSHLNIVTLVTYVCQMKVDLARAYYLQVLFKYMAGLHSRYTGATWSSY